MQEDITEILKSFTRSSQTANAELFSVLYADLKKIAIGQMKREQAGHTLQATALVHETFLKLMNLKSCQWNNRHHFFVSASEMMRRILIDHARASKRLKRGGQHQRVPMSDLDATLAQSDEVDHNESLLLLDEVLQELEQLAPQKAEVVKLRFFSRMKYDQIADILGISKSTAERYWVFCKAWLNRRLEERASKGAMLDDG